MRSQLHHTQIQLTKSTLPMRTNCIRSNTVPISIVAKKEYILCYIFSLRTTSFISFLPSSIIALAKASTSLLSQLSKDLRHRSNLIAQSSLVIRLTSSIFNLIFSPMGRFFEHRIFYIYNLLLWSDSDWHVLLVAVSTELIFPCFCSGVFWLHFLSHFEHHPQGVSYTQFIVPIIILTLYSPWHIFSNY